MRFLSSALMLLLALPAQTAKAESSSATMTVSVQVIARAIATVESAPAQLEVTAADVARGYVDLPAQIVVRVKTNSRNGYVLQTTNVSSAFRAIELRSGTALFDVRVETFMQRPWVETGDVLEISGRAWLDAGATPGTYALPVRFEARPL